MERKGRCRWQWEEREGSAEGGECMGIQCKGLANLSDLSHCSTLKASASIVRALGLVLCASGEKLDEEERGKETANGRKLKKVRGCDRSIN